MKAIACEFPIQTRLLRHLEAITCWDAYTLDLVEFDQTIEQVYLGIFGHMPAGLCQTNVAHRGHGW